MIKRGILPMVVEIKSHIETQDKAQGMFWKAGKRRIRDVAVFTSPHADRYLVLGSIGTGISIAASGIAALRNHMKEPSKG